MRHRFRRRLQPRQAARTTRHTLHTRDIALRFLLRRERPDCIPIGQEAGEHELHWVVGRGEIQAAGQFLLEVYQ